MAEKMRVALGQFRDLTDEKLLFAKQLGITDVQLNTPNIPGETHWDFRDLLLLRTRAEDAGCRLIALENVPNSFYVEAMLGLPRRDEQIEHYQQTVRNMGRAGIPILGINWMPNGVWRTSRTTPDRGGAKVTSYDHELAKDAPLTHGREYSEEELFENYVYFMKAVLPVADEAGVKLAVHPDDPPVPSIGGVPRIFRSFEHFKRGLEVVPSPSLGLDFCQGCWSEMAPNVFEPIRYFGSRGKIIYVHLRDVKGQVPKFQETFVGQGNVSPFEALKVYKEVGFTGFFLDDHVPHIVDDTDWGHRSRAYAIGYITALLEVVDSLA